MLKHMLSGTAIALLIAAGPAYAQTTDEAEDPQTELEMQDGEDAVDEESAGDTAVDTDADIDEDTAADTDADVDEDTAVDTDADTGVDTTAQDDAMDTDTDTTAQDDAGIDDTEMTGSVDEPEVTERFIQVQAEDELLANELIGSNVENSEGESLGSINDLLIHDDIGVKAVVIGVGGFLGIGQKNVAVNYDEIDQVRDENGEVTLVFAAASEELEDAPEFTTYEQQLAESEQDQMQMQQDTATQPPAAMD